MTRYRMISMWLRRKPTLDKLSPEETQLVAQRLAMKLLGIREHTVLELRHKLAQRGFDGTLIETVLADLVAADYLDDMRFAEVYAHSRADKGYGPLRIGRELRERGVSEVIVTNVLQQFDDFWGPKLAALQRRRFGASLPRDLASRAQQLRFLRQRGFTQGQIKALFEDS